MPNVPIQIEIGSIEKDLIDALAALVISLKAKSSLTDIITVQIPNIIKLSGEFSGIADEFKNSDKEATAYYLAKQIEAALA